MTFDEDPTRWTSSPDDAPELLRGAFASARNEGPSRTQMRSLALKLAAASAGGAVAVGTVKAASAGQTFATAASWSAGKIAAMVAVAGTLVTGGAVVWHAGTAPQSGSDGHVARAPAAAVASTPEEQTPSAAGAQAQPELAPGAPRVEPVEGTPVVETLSNARGESRALPAVAPMERTTERTTLTKRPPGVGGAAKAINATAKPARASVEKLTATQEPQRASQAARAAVETRRSNEKPTAPPSEIELLRRAQVALTGRPREAFQLTQEHRKFYPAGEFTQERDALAIQALMRSGDTDKARDLAATFIRSYPSSPHAHRFREAMGLR